MIVIALAGRRVDAENAPERFPATRIPIVRERLRAFLLERHAAALVCSAACGADLLALGLAGDLGLRRRIVLPFAPERFRKTSVIDRGGDWGPVYDRALEAVRAADDLVVLKNAGEETDAYAKANLALLDEARALAETGEEPRSVIVAIAWEGAPRGSQDLTAHLLEEARTRGLEIVEIPTM
jgi:hypothetical protein